MCRIRAHSLCETTAWQRHVKRSACSASRSFCIGACCHSSAWPAEFHPSHTPSETKPTKEKYMRSERGRGSRASFWLLDSIPHRYMTVLVMPVGNASRRFFPTLTPPVAQTRRRRQLCKASRLASKTSTRAWPRSPRPKKPGALLSRGPLETFRESFDRSSESLSGSLAYPPAAPRTSELAPFSAGSRLAMAQHARHVGTQGLALLSPS